MDPFSRVKIPKGVKARRPAVIMARTGLALPVARFKAYQIAEEEMSPYCFGGL